MYTSVLLIGLQGVDRDNFILNCLIYWYVENHYFYSFVNMLVQVTVCYLVQ